MKKIESIKEEIKKRYKAFSFKGWIYWGIWLLSLTYLLLTLLERTIYVQKIIINSLEIPINYPFLFLIINNASLLLLFDDEEKRNKLKWLEDQD